MSSALDEALDRYSLMTSTINSPFVPEVLDVIGEVKISNFTEEELQNVSFIKMWFDIKLKPFIPSVSKEFLSCLSTKNFSCETYQAVVRALSEQISSLDRKQERFVYTHFIHLFLSRNDTSDPSCLSSTDGSTDWLQKNFGNFTVFAPLEDLVRLNDNFSSFETLALLTPTQTADLTVISGALKNTDQINTVFDQLETEDPFRNIDEYLTQLSTRSELPEIKPAVRDIMMTRTFHIIKMKFPEFEGQDWMLWFHVKLILVLPSIKAEMLSIAISNISCTNYHIIVGGIGKVSENMESHRKREIAQVLVDHLKESAHQIREPACRENIQNDADFLQINLGPFSEDVTYSDLKDLNITGLEVLDTLSPEQKAVLILDPSSNALENETTVRIIFNSLLESPEEEELEELEEFYEAFVEATEEENVKVIENPRVRDTMLNLTLMALAPQFPVFEPSDFALWFQVNLVVLLASFNPGSLVVIPMNISCDSYHAILKGLDQSLASLPPELTQGIASSREILIQRVPKGCKDSAPTPTPSDGDHDLDSLSPDQKVNLLLDPRTGALDNETIVREVFASLLNSPPDRQLEMFFDAFVDATNQRNLTVISNTAVRDTLLNLTLTALTSMFHIFEPNNFTVWFQVNLALLLPGINSHSLAVIPKNISCDSYHAIIKGFGNVVASLSNEQSQNIYSFALNYLSARPTQGSSCVLVDANDRNWLVQNFGQFRVHASYTDFLKLNKDFNGVDIVDLLTETHIAQLAATPRQLKTSKDVNKIIAAIHPANFGAFFDIVSPAIQENEANYSYEVKSAMLQEVIDKGNLSAPSIADTEILVWLRVRLSPLIQNLTASQVAVFFNIVQNRSCNTSQETVNLLDSVRSTLNEDTKNEIFSKILFSLKEPTPIHCYEKGSFYLFLRSTFVHFGNPNLTTFLSLMPSHRKPELINSIQPSELSSFLSHPKVIDKEAELCIIFNNYNRTPDFLEMQGDIPDDARRSILPCVWPLALSSENETEVDLWFEKRLKLYLTFLTKDLISSTETLNAKCLPFRKIVSVLGNNSNYNSSDFGQEDVYKTIKSYLSTGTKPRCYNASDPQLNSTAWFANYIGVFVTFISLADLNTFVSTDQINIFLEDPKNIQIFNNPAIPENVTSFYTLQIYTQNPNFSPLLLPGNFLCEVPSSAYMSLNQDESIAILDVLNSFCNDSADPEVSAALAENFVTISKVAIESLGQQSTGLTAGQIKGTPPSVLLSSLQTLSDVQGWNQGQSSSLVRALTTGGFKIKDATSLLSLGTIVGGVPSASFTSIPPSELITTAQNPTFIKNMKNAPKILQNTYVSKIITVNRDPNIVLQNVPDEMAAEIPSVLLTFSQGPVEVQKINQKTWTQDQASVFFEKVAHGSNDSEILTPSVLQGFSCSGVRTVDFSKVRKLIRACRPRQNRRKVVLKESQLTCMYNYIKNDGPEIFTDYPSDMLLYYNYEKVGQVQCNSYFTATGAADFSVLSKVLNKEVNLLNNAKGCLGIRGTSINRTNVEILGNMCCTLDGSYIENSDPLILEKLKNCKDLSEIQIASVQKVLLTGNTKYGNASTWNRQTLEDLGILPLYLTKDFWDRFDSSVKRKFLKVYLPQLRRNKTEKKKLKSLFKQSNSVRSVRSKRAAGCTIGNITQSTISDGAFPFGYDASQFDLCLDVKIVKDNLEALTEKVANADFQKIILAKLNQAYPTGIADEQVQVLGPVSRVASIDDINNWNVTSLDTLAALMLTEDGQWESDQRGQCFGHFVLRP
ncbi:uncharacterized protein LOC118219721 isoform X2 [Anguilla anguilla]|uniref:uncharacterized protein LOC118219721 isoform X2 n=1 Tax=Anguilla anguilla TaxID=7936 RepID=UPI0015AEFB34|nr:uncharacterized protein LOC118219721 isoform X2 [Anguilla anguilla]